MKDDRQYIKATFVITASKTLETTIKMIEKYCSTTSEKMLENISIALFGSKKFSRKGKSPQESMKEIQRYFVQVRDPLQVRDKNEFVLNIEVPLETFDLSKGGISHLLTIFAGQIFKDQEVKDIKWVDLTFPPGYLEERADILGPRYGIKGIQQQLGIPDGQPLIAAILQPNIGLEAEEYAKLCKFIADKGVDIIVEDDILVDPANCSIKERAVRVFEALNDLSKPKLYFVNAMSWSDWFEETLFNLLKEMNTQSKNKTLVGFYIDPFYSGFSAVKRIRNSNTLCPIFSQYFSMGLFIKNPSYGISTRVLTMLAQISGADFVYIGNVCGSFISDGPEWLSHSVIDALEYISTQKKAYPVVCGKITPRNIIANIKVLGPNIVLEAASGIFEHENGLKDGIEAFRETISLATQHCLTDCHEQKCSECNHYLDALKKSSALKLAFNRGHPIFPETI